MDSGASMTSDKMSKVLKAIADLVKQDVLVGIPDSAPDRKDGPISNAAIGYIQEKGSPINNIPARPFLVPGVDEVQSKVADQLGKAADSALDGSQAGIEKALNSAGFVAQNSVKRKINSNIQPELAKRTIAARKARGITQENTLVVTGGLRNAITYVLRKK